MINKNLYQTWKTKKIPNTHIDYVNSFKFFNNFDKYELYTDIDIDNFMKKNYQEYYDKWNNMVKKIEKIDFWRYAIIYHYGGIYADIDMEQKKDISWLFNLNTLFFSGECINHLIVDDDYQPKNNPNNIILPSCAFFGAPKNNLIIKEIMDYCIQNYKIGDKPVYNTGPRMLLNFFNKYPKHLNNCILFASNTFHPAIHFENSFESYTIHHYTNYLTRNKESLYRYIIRNISNIFKYYLKKIIWYI